MGQGARAAPSPAGPLWPCWENTAAGEANGFQTCGNAGTCGCQDAGPDPAEPWRSSTGLTRPIPFHPNPSYPIPSHPTETPEGAAWPRLPAAPPTSPLAQEDVQDWPLCPKLPNFGAVQASEAAVLRRCPIAGELGELCPGQPGPCSIRVHLLPAGTGSHPRGGCPCLPTQGDWGWQTWEPLETPLGGEEQQNGLKGMGFCETF